MITQETGTTDPWCGWSGTRVTAPAWANFSWVELVKYFQAFKISFFFFKTTLTSYPGKVPSKTERKRKEKKAKLERKVRRKTWAYWAPDVCFSRSLISTPGAHTLRQNSPYHESPPASYGTKRTNSIRLLANHGDWWTWTILGCQLDYICY